MKKLNVLTRLRERLSRKKIKIPKQIKNKEELKEYLLDKEVLKSCNLKRQRIMNVLNNVDRVRAIFILATITAILKSNGDKFDELNEETSLFNFVWEWSLEELLGTPINAEEEVINEVEKYIG